MPVTVKELRLNLTAYNL